jgi:hypothetical protein
MEASSSSSKSSSSCFSNDSSSCFRRKSSGRLPKHLNRFQAWDAQQQQQHSSKVLRVKPVLQKAAKHTISSIISRTGASTADVLAGADADANALLIST